MVGLNIAFNFPTIKNAELLSVLTFEYYNVYEFHHGHYVVI